MVEWDVDERALAAVAAKLALVDVVVVVAAFNDGPQSIPDVFWITFLAAAVVVELLLLQVLLLRLLLALLFVAISFCLGKNVSLLVAASSKGDDDADMFALLLVRLLLMLLIVLLLVVLNRCLTLDSSCSMVAVFANST